MLKKTLAGILFLTVSTALIGCGGDKQASDISAPAKAEAAQSATDYLKNYSFIMDGVYDYAAKGLDDKLVNEGTGGIREVVEVNKEKSGAIIGYTLQDLNGDEVPELVLGYAKDKHGAGYVIMAAIFTQCIRL